MAKTVFLKPKVAKIVFLRPKVAEAGQNSWKSQNRNAKKTDTANSQNCFGWPLVDTQVNDKVIKSKYHKALICTLTITSIAQTNKIIYGWRSVTII